MRNYKSEKLTIKEGGNVKQYGFSMLNYGWFFEELLATQGALYVDNENGRKDLQRRRYLTVKKDRKYLEC